MHVPNYLVMQVVRLHVKIFTYKPRLNDVIFFYYSTFTNVNEQAKLRTKLH